MLNSINLGLINLGTSIMAGAIGLGSANNRRFSTQSNTMHYNVRMIKISKHEVYFNIIPFDLNY